MKIHYLAAIPVTALMVACGGSTPEPSTPASAAATEEKSETPAQEKAEGAEAPKPAEAAPADAAKPAEAPADKTEKKK